MPAFCSRRTGLPFRSGGALLLAVNNIALLAYASTALAAVNVSLNARTSGRDQPKCTPPIFNLKDFPDDHDCIELKRVCVDQGTLVSFDPGLDSNALPSLNLSDIVYNIPDKHGIGDRFTKGSALPFGDLRIRPATNVEESPDLASPAFSRCTLPLLLYADYPFNMGETLRMGFAAMVQLQQAGAFDRRVTLLPGLPEGTRVPPYTRFWFRTLTDREVVSLATLSARQPHPTPPVDPSTTTTTAATGAGSWPSLSGPSPPWRSSSSPAPLPWTWEGSPVRCFERFAACRIRGEQGWPDYGAAMDHVVRHYAPQLRAGDAAYRAALGERYHVMLPTSDRSTLLVVFVRRSPAHLHSGRSLINEAELLASCNAGAPYDLPPPEWRAPYKRYFCFPYVFGGDMLMDVWLMRQVHVLVGVHGAGLNNAFYLRPGGSIVEVRPYGFGGADSWANMYLREMTDDEGKFKRFWYGIDVMDPANSRPGEIELLAQQNQQYNQFQLLWARDRHVLLPWPCLRHHLLNIALAGRARERYTFLRLRQAYYVTDALQQAEAAGQDVVLPRAQQRNTTGGWEAVRQALLDWVSGRGPGPT